MARQRMGGGTMSNDVSEMISHAVRRADLVNRVRMILGPSNDQHVWSERVNDRKVEAWFKERAERDPRRFFLVGAKDAEDTPDTPDTSDLMTHGSLCLTITTNCGDHEEIVSLIADLLNFARDGL
jgi:hypothetical protein